MDAKIIEITSVVYTMYKNGSCRMASVEMIPYNEYPHFCDT